MVAIAVDTNVVESFGGEQEREGGVGNRQLLMGLCRTFINFYLEQNLISEIAYDF